MILKSIFNGSLSIEVLLIKDDSYASGHHVLKEVLSSFKDPVSIHFLNYEKNPYNTEGINCRTKQYDCSVTNCPWLFQIDKNLITLESVTSSLIKEVPLSQQVIVVDSVFNLLMFDGVYKLCQIFNKLSTVKFKTGVSAFPLIFTIHNFDEENIDHRKLESLSNIIFSVKNSSNPERIVLSATQKKPSGRIILEKYSCWLDESNKFKYEEIKDVKEKKIEPEDGPDMSALTTFKLTLEDKELQSRSKLVLPFMRRQEEERSGKIYYEPDANDDWDDEDPDDDLEI